MRAQLVTIVQQRVWPVFCRTAGRNKRGRDGSPPPPRACPPLGMGPGASVAETEAVRHALAIGFAPRLAKRLPQHNGYRTLAASKASVACAPPLFCLLRSPASVLHSRSAARIWQAALEQCLQFWLEMDSSRHGRIVGHPGSLASMSRPLNSAGAAKSRARSARSRHRQPCRSVHGDCAKMAVEDGLLPEWLVFHELVGGPRPTLRRVSAVAATWVQPALQRLQALDAQRLARAGAAAQPAAAAAGGGDAAAAPAAERKGAAVEAISAAKARALARRAAGGAKRGRR